MDIFELLHTKYQDEDINTKIIIEDIVPYIEKLPITKFRYPGLKIKNEIILDKQMITEYLDNPYPNKFTFGNILGDLSRTLFNNVDKFFNNVDKSINNKNEITLKSDGIICISFVVMLNEKKDLVCYVETLHKTKSYSGGRLLENLEMLVRTYTKEIKKIELEDKSNILLKGTDNINMTNSIPLYSVYICVKGQSWYNSLGYHQEYYHEEKEEWDTTRNMLFVDYAEEFKEMIKDMDVYINPQELDYHLRKIARLYNSKMTCCDVYTILYSLLKNNINVDVKIVDSCIYMLKLTRFFFEYDANLSKTIV